MKRVFDFINNYLVAILLVLALFIFVFRIYTNLTYQFSFTSDNTVTTEVELAKGMRHTVLFNSDFIKYELTYSAENKTNLIINESTIPSVSWTGDSIEGFSINSLTIIFINEKQTTPFIVNLAENSYGCIPKSTLAKTYECTLFKLDDSNQWLTVTDQLTIIESLTFTISLIFIPIIISIAYKCSKNLNQRSQNKKHKNNKWLPYLLLTLLSFWVYFTIISPGIEKPMFFSVLSPLSTPRLGDTSFSYFNFQSISYPLRSLLLILLGINFEMPAYLILIIFTNALSYFYAVKRISNSQIGIIIAIIATVNPIIASRLYLGHDYLIIAFAILPWIFTFIKQLLNTFSINVFIKTLLLIVLVITIAPHLIPAILIICLVALILILFCKPKYSPEFEKSGLIYLTLLFASFINLVLALNNNLSDIANFSNNEIQMFATRGDTFFGTVINIIGFHGLWVEKGILPTGKDFLGIFWILLPSLYLLPALIGFFQIKKLRIKIAFALSIVAIISLILLTPLAIDLDIAFFKGIREATKLIIVYFSILLMMQIPFWNSLLNQRNATFFKIIVFGFFGLLVIFNGYQLDQYQERISKCDFPSEIVELNTKIDANSKVLVAPKDNGDYFEFCPNLFGHGFANEINGIKIDYDQNYFNNIQTSEELRAYLIKLDIKYFIYMTNSEAYSIADNACISIKKTPNIIVCLVK